MLNQMNIRFVFLFLIFVIPKITLGQNALIATVKDKNTLSPIPFCAVGVKNKSLSTITNEDGVFTFKNLEENDTLLFSYLGYTKRELSVKTLASDPVVLLSAKMNLLQEVVVSSDNSFLYELILQARKKLLKSPTYTSKTYFTLETEVEKQPTELIECYYNTKFSNSGIDEMTFKNGRIGMAGYKGYYFINTNTSRVLLNSSLIYNNSNVPLPYHPLQLNKKELKRIYILELKSVSDTDTPEYQIEFKPRSATGEYYSGYIWINKTTYQISAVILNIDKAKRHPFLPLFPDGKIEQAGFSVRYYFNHQDKKPEHIDFRLNFLYSNDSISTIMQSKGILFFYDYNQLFSPLYFNYPDDMNDYWRIVSLSYNDQFWLNNKGLVYSDKMKKGIQYFKNNGQLINYNGKISLVRKDSIHFFENNYLVWDSIKRLAVKKDLKSNQKNLPKLNMGRPDFISDLYQIKAQVFMDVNTFNDSIQIFTKTVLDVYDTFVNLQETPEFNCFINIYFDLYEIARRQLEAACRKARSAEEIDKIYKKLISETEEKVNRFSRDAQSGKNKKAMQQWSNNVFYELHIDNMKLFALNP